MFCHVGFAQGLATIMQHLTPLSKPQAMVLAWWSFGMVLARSCALTAVSHGLAKGKVYHSSCTKLSSCPFGSVR